MINISKEMLVACAVLFCTVAAKAVEVDGIAATVGNETILKNDIYNELRRAGLDESHYNEMRTTLIDRKLILKAASESKMTLQEWVVDNRIREIIDDAFGGDRNKLIAMLGQQKIPYTEWRKKIRDDMVVSAMRWNTVDKYTNASPSEMKAEYAAHPERYAQGAKTTVAVILLRPADIDKKDMISELLQTREFGDIAKDYSADPRAADGGLWKDVVATEVFRPEIAEEISKMPKGTISDWIDLDGWSFLIKKINDTSEKTRSFAEAYNDIEANVRDANARKAYNEWIERLRSETYIKVW